MCVSPNVGGSEMSQLWVGIGGSEKNWLWCAANGMSGKQRYSKCTKWPPSALIHASSLFCHWSTVSSTMLCWNSAHVATRRGRFPQLVRIANWYSIHVKKKEKTKNLCNFYKVVGRHFSETAHRQTHMDTQTYVTNVLPQPHSCTVKCKNSTILQQLKLILGERVP